ncbi:MAG: hypothetical protein EPN89_14585 [Methylovulum sp.]|nr:MAG: hypothetical protein EPN89_14585 [Methylovulum sp.]
MTVAVVTHTHEHWQRDMTRCFNSVAAALPDGCEHIVIGVDTDYDGFIEARYAALQLADIIIFVDDDYVSPESITLCLAALAATDASLAYTSEMLVFNDGNRLASAVCTHYEAIPRSPSAIHHMAAIRSSAVTERSIILAREYGCGIEWIMKVEAALTQGAIHIPHMGYYYVQHPRQVSHAVGKRFAGAIKPIGEEIQSWGGRALIPVFDGGL